MLISPITNGIPRSIKEVTKSPELEYIQLVILGLISTIRQSVDCSMIYNVVKTWLQYISNLPNLELHNIWLSLHFTTIVGAFGHFLLTFLLNNQNNLFCYKLAVYSMIFTYFIVVYRYFLVVINDTDNNLDFNDEIQTFQRSNSIDDGDSVNGFDNAVESKNESISVSEIKIEPLLIMLRSDNFYLLMLTLLCRATEPKLVKLIPFTFYSLLNISDYLCKTFDHIKVVKSVYPFFQYLETPTMSLAARIDLWLMVVYTYEGLLLGNFSSALLYGFIYLLRLEESTYSREVLNSVNKSLIGMFKILEIRRELEGELEGELERN